jgi:hypothetical protein
MTLQSAWTFYLAHAAAIHLAVPIVCGALYTVIQVMLRLAPLASWVAIAEKSPRVASFVRLLGALGIQPLPALQALIDMLRGQASPGTVASAAALEVSSAKPLISPPPKPK